jgi:hypothetical protein
MKEPDGQPQKQTRRIDIDDYDIDGFSPCICGSKDQYLIASSDDNISITCNNCGRYIFGDHLTIIPDWNNESLDFSKELPPHD